MEDNNHFNYFAYASNLQISTLEQRTGEKIENYQQGRLADYGFRFNVKNSDGTARANLIASESEDVFGLICQISTKYRDALLSTEPGFRLISVSIETEQDDVQAFTFISDSEEENIYPSKEYLKSIMAGAKELSLPEEYTDFIVSMSK
ncbi:MAG: gamma-glutamylcyclotransferase [Pedobacter sp.]|jgi:hypothetical protein